MLNTKKCYCGNVNRYEENICLACGEHLLIKEYHDLDRKVGDNWLGPYGLIISNDVQSIPGHDGNNIINKPCTAKLSKEEYLAKYGELRHDNKYYYKSVSDNCWTGPYGLQIPKSIEYVMAGDGYNLYYQTGHLSKKEN